MEQRIDYRRAAPAALGSVLAMDRYVRDSGLEQSLLHVIKLRASQINGCAYCVDMHSREARTAGESEQRLYALPVWSETPFFTERERAGLAWAEALTLISNRGVPDELYRAAREHFSEKELVDLTVAVAAINSLNRIAISFRPPVGEYVPATAARADRAT